MEHTLIPSVIGKTKISLVNRLRMGVKAIRLLMLLDFGI